MRQRIQILVLIQAAHLGCPGDAYIAEHTEFYRSARKRAPLNIVDPRQIAEFAKSGRLQTLLQRQRDGRSAMLDSDLCKPSRGFRIPARRICCGEQICRIQLLRYIDPINATFVELRRMTFDGRALAQSVTQGGGSKPVAVPVAIECVVFSDASQLDRIIGVSTLNQRRTRQ